jgi:two-component system cell cycle sensor histidine kinase/response regulator CckA
MRRYVSLLIVFLVIVAGLSRADAAFSSDPRVPPKTIKVVMDNNYPPYVFLDGKGNLQGILIDQWRLWEQKTGIKADISGMDWGEALRRMATAEFDVIDTIFFNESRAKIYDFSKPYAKIDVSIFFHKSISGISNVASLQGFPVAVKSGDNAIDYLRGQGINLFQEYPSYESIIKAAKAQKVTVGVIDNPPALHFLYKMGILDQFRCSAPLYTGEFHRAVKKGDAAILSLVEEGFSQISDSEYRAIHEKWFGTEINPLHHYLRPIAIGLGALILVVLLLVAWNRILQKKVRERTLRLEEEVELNIKKTEALRENEEKYRELVENANSIILRMDREGRVTFFNEFAEQFFGFPKGDIVGRNVVGTIVPKEETTGRDLAAMIADLGRNPEAYVINENENIRRNGERVWIAWTNKPTFGPNNDVSEILCIGNDITERKRTEEALRENMQQYKAVFENTGAATVIIEKDTTISLCNAEFERLSEYARNQIEGKKSWTEFVVSQDMDHMIAQHRMRRESHGKAMKRYEFRFVPRTGEVRDIYLIIDTIHGTEKSVASLIDITDHKRTEEEIARERAKLQTLSDNAPFGMVLVDKEGHFTYINRKFTNLFGFALSDIPDGRTWFRKAYPDPGYRHTVIATWMEDWRDAKPGELKPRVFTASCKDGTQKIVQFNTSVLISGEYLMTCEDITDRKRLEAQLIQAQKMEAIGTLAGGIAHDFNNLLMGIQGYASIMMLELDTGHPHYERLKRIEEQVRSAADLTRQLLGFARGGRYEMRPLDMNTILKKSSSMFGRTKKELIIHGKYEKDLRTVEADQGQIEQVLLNLYVNAWHAMPTGGELCLETKNVALDERYAALHDMPPGNYVRVSVTDTGTGMDEKTRKRIFDPFFTTKEMGRGTGLGLAMAYGIMKGHRGFIQVYSEPGHGTTFTLYLPASGKRPLEEKPAVPDVRRGSGTILFVDDEPGVLAVSKEILESLGYTVYGMASGQEAIAFYEEKREDISLIILDMIMPGLSGGETFDRIRELNPTARIILSSGYSLNDQAQQIMDKGCHGFIQKPFDIPGISRKIREVLEG